MATAFGEMELAIRALQLDASDFITKPINDEALHLALKRARERYTSRKQLADYTDLLENGKGETSQQLVMNYHISEEPDRKLHGRHPGLRPERGGHLQPQHGIDFGIRPGRGDRPHAPGTTFSGPRRRGPMRKAMVGNAYGGKNRLTCTKPHLLGPLERTIPDSSFGHDPVGSGTSTDGLVCFFRDLREIRHLEREVADQARILHQDKMMSLGPVGGQCGPRNQQSPFGNSKLFRLMIRISDRGPLDREHRPKFSVTLDLLRSETDRCSQIVSSLLTFSRKSTPSFDRG